MTDNTYTNNRLLNIALIEESARKEQEHYDALVAAVAFLLSESKEKIATALTAASEMRDAIKADALAYVADGGPVEDLHAALTFSRHTTLVYDKEEVLKAALAAGADDLIRRKAPELNVKAFEAQARADKLPWAQAEIVPAPRISIGKLGDLLIAADLDREAE